jgi:hypothetical protein
MPAPVPAPAISLTIMPRHGHVRGPVARYLLGHALSRALSRLRPAADDDLVELRLGA